MKTPATLCGNDIGKRLEPIGTKFRFAGFPGICYRREHSSFRGVPLRTLGQQIRPQRKHLEVASAPPASSEQTLRTSPNNEWWARRLHLLQSRHNLSREDTRKAWNLLWEEWAKLDTRFLNLHWLSDKIRMGLALRKVDPLACMIAPTFLMGLTAKGMTVDELAGLVDSFLDHGWFREYEKFELPDPMTVYSNGFGGDGIKTINVSTAAMIVAASAGVSCYKMGSRSYFSHSGSHDFLEIVGVRASTTAQHALQSLREAGIAFIDGVHTADRCTQGIGDGLAIMPRANQLMKVFTYPFRFPILCLNPLKPRISSRGVSTLDTEIPAEVLRSYYPYSERFEVVAGMSDDGIVIDEVSNIGPTKITEFRDGTMRTHFTTPADWGVRQVQPNEIRCADSWLAAMKVIAILGGHCNDAHADLVSINAAQFLYLAGKVRSRREGTEAARAAIADGAALKKLRVWVEVSGGSLGALDWIVAAATHGDTISQSRRFHPNQLHRRERDI